MTSTGTRITALESCKNANHIWVWYGNHAMDDSNPPDYFRCKCGKLEWKDRYSLLIKMENITHLEWKLYEWVEQAGESDKERWFIRGKERTPDEAAKASADYEQLATAKRVWLKKRND